MSDLGLCLFRFQRQVEEALEDVDGNRDVAAKVREAVAEAVRSQGAAGVSSAIQVQVSVSHTHVCDFCLCGLFVK